MVTSERWYLMASSSGLVCKNYDFGSLPTEERVGLSDNEQIMVTSQVSLFYFILFYFFEAFVFIIRGTSFYAGGGREGV
jgi:hypothetical protein